MPQQQFPLIRALHLRLAKRLALGAFVVALLCGVITFAVEMEEVDTALSNLALQEAQAFAQSYPYPLQSADEERIAQALSDFLARQHASGKSHFLLAEVYDAQKDEVGQAGGELPDAVKSKIDTATHRFPKTEPSWYQKISFGDDVYVQVLTVLKSPDDRVRGYFEGVYEIPFDQMQAIQGRVSRAVLMVVLVVLMTTVVLYPIILSLHREQQALSKELLQANLDTLSVLGSAIAKRDSDTHSHNFRVALYSLGLGEALALPASALRELLKGAWLHDVGKIAISDTILLKPGKLDDDEFAVMKSHVGHGLEIVSHSSWLTEASEVVGGHHEKWDGGGYPQGLVGEAIPLNARIFALADVFDALTSQRPYKKPLSCSEALDIMEKGRGSHFDPNLFDLFARVVPSMYDEFGGREDDAARDLLRLRGRQYFFSD